LHFYCKIRKNSIKTVSCGTKAIANKNKKLLNGVDIGILNSKQAKVYSKSTVVKKRVNIEKNLPYFKMFHTFVKQYENLTV